MIEMEVDRRLRLSDRRVTTSVRAVQYVPPRQVGGFDSLQFTTSIHLISAIARNDVAKKTDCRSGAFI